MVIIILENAGCEVDLRRTRRLLLGGTLGSKSLGSGLFPDAIKVVKVWTA
jgi:hypothetical protein